MKICFLSAGTFTHIQPYIDYFKEQGHEVHFIALSPSPERNVPVHNAWEGKEYDVREKSNKYKYIKAAFRARKIIKGLQPDIIHAHYVTSGGLAAYIIHHPHTIVTAHGSDINASVKSPVWRFLLKRILGRAAAINVVSRELYDKVLQLGIPAHKLHNFNVGINYETFFQHHASHAAPYTLKMVCNRRFEPVYDHMTILKALVLLKEKNVPFEMHFVGGGPLQEAAEKFVQENGLDKYVTFYGQVQNSVQPGVFEKCNIYISSSLSDGTSLSLLEAMAAGLFPVVTDIVANKAVLEHNRSALFFPVGDSGNLAEQLIYLRSEFFGRVPVIISENQQFVVREGNRPANMQKLEKIYNEIIKPAK
ncbi:glycosyltransferase [Chitinophaga sancti]|uniref:Glycosyltransferase involved in cell wall bisynthesis n=2 Tax=Chitinophaga sancti TaxID=1004 RepID=A0A1K1MS17_9BACT|nr:glycosyltransferase [Chitinophaga sancti]WQD62925.1 glycosyltransferase [Chitinophaga sancti]SFW25873.1 Glycosyltransferase involved in cell wall bisynthesis [Chitinophaga sancti]